VSLPTEKVFDGYEIHPALLDGCFQGIAGLMRDTNELWLPVSIGRYEILSSSPLESPKSLRFRIIESAPPTSTTRQFDLTITTAEQTPIANILQMVVKRVANPDPASQGLVDTTLSSTANRFGEYTTACVSESVENCCLDATCQHTVAKASGDECCGVTEDPLLIRLRHRLSAIIECDEAELDVDTPLENLGFDSMMAIEMLDALEKDFGVKIPTDQFWSGLTLGGLLQRVHNQSALVVDTNDNAVQWVEGTL
jgi:acyl carrier protein